jgi:hydrogenase maturation protein HypF
VGAPGRTALALLREVFGRGEAERLARRLFPGIPPGTARLLLDALDKGVNVVPTSSAGRLFDAASAICGLCRHATFEGQAPMALEGAAAKAPAGTYPFSLSTDRGLLAIHWTGMVEGMVADATNRVPPGTIARRFHDTLAAAVLAAASRLAGTSGARHVILTGGVFQNATLLKAVTGGLRRARLVPLIHRQVPPNDGGISLGQAYYAALRVAGG